MNSINAINRAAGIKNANESETLPYPPPCMKNSGASRLLGITKLINDFNEVL